MTEKSPPLSTVTDPDFTPIEDKVYLTYWTGINNCDIDIFGASAPITTYKSCNSYYGETVGVPSITADPNSHSINFASEINSYTFADEDVSLFSLYHENYIDTIFHQSLRYYTFNAILSAPKIMNLRLNDTIKINDLYYQLNEIQSNLLSGEVNITCVNLIRGLGVLPAPIDTTKPTTGQLMVVENPDVVAPTIGVISFVSATENSITVSWTDAVDPPPDATGVYIYRIFKDSIIDIQKAFGTNIATLTGLLPSTSYDIDMEAWDNADPNNISSLSNTISPSTTVSTDVIPPSFPPQPNLTVTQITSTSIRIEWVSATDTNGIESYHIFQDTVEVQQEGGNTNTVLISLLTPATTYDFYVTAKDPAGNESLKTQTQTATTDP